MKKNPKVLISLVLCVASFVLIYNFGESSSSATPSDFVSNRNKQDDGEWVSLNNRIYVRKPATFYFYDENRIEALILTESKSEEIPLACVIKIKDRTVITNADLFLILHTFEHPFRLFSLRCNLTNTNIDLHDKIELYVRHLQTNATTKEPVYAAIKAKDLIKKKGKFLLCTKYLSLDTDEHYADFKAWIEINIKMGYEKIFMHNSSIVNNEKFNGLFEKYKGIVEVKSYKQFPFLDNTNEANMTDNYRKNKEARLSDLRLKIEFLHEQASINECYMSYRTYYDHIAQFDTDELIVPKMTYKKEKNLNETLQCGSNVESKSDLEVYFDNLYKIDKYKDAVSLWFNYVDVDYNETLIEIIQQLKSVVPTLDPNQPYGKINLQLRSYYNEIQEYAVVRYEIKTKAEYDYAKYLIDIYDQLNNTYADFNVMKHRFSSSLILYNVTDYYFWSGKSIHNTKYVKYIVIHYAYYDPYVPVDLQHGYAAHFRTKLKHFYLLKKSNTIENIYIDHNQFECYVSKVES